MKCVVIPSVRECEECGEADCDLDLTEEREIDPEGHHHRTHAIGESFLQEGELQLTHSAQG